MKILEETIQPGDILMLTSNHIVRDAKTLSLLFEEAISKGRERDKKPEDATTVEELIEMYEIQGKKKQ